MPNPGFRALSDLEFISQIGLLIKEGELIIISIALVSS
jgi:hypothetical protein